MICYIELFVILKDFIVVREALLPWLIHQDMELVWKRNTTWKSVFLDRFSS